MIEKSDLIDHQIEISFPINDKNSIINIDKYMSAIELSAKTSEISLYFLNRLKFHKSKLYGSIT
mgnify:CR=1 FL=1